MLKFYITGMLMLIVMVNVHVKSHVTVLSHMIQYVAQMVELIQTHVKRNASKFKMFHIHTSMKMHLTIIVSKELSNTRSYWRCFNILYLVRKQKLRLTRPGRLQRVRANHLL